MAYAMKSYQTQKSVLKNICKFSVRAIPMSISKPNQYTRLKNNNI